MSKQVKASDDKTTLRDNVDENREYGNSDLNWKDTGDETNDPSMKGFNSGYNEDPYQFQQWASRGVLYQVKQGDSLWTIAERELGSGKEWTKIAKLNQELIKDPRKINPGQMLILKHEPMHTALSKTAGNFMVTDYDFTPDGLAREILTVWGGNRGPIQNFYDAFVMNRFTNEMREQIADSLRNWGYEITPRYEDRTPRYASKTAYASYVKVAEAALEDDDAAKLLKYFKDNFPKSQVAQALHEAVAELNHVGHRVALAEAGGLLDYYKQIYPDDYAASLIDISLDKGPYMGFQEFEDMQLNTQDMEQIDKYDSETAEPSADKTRGPAGYEYGIGGGGWDPTTDMRSDEGFPASGYETRANRITNRIKLNLKKK